MLTKDRLNVRVRDRRLILEPMSYGVEGASELAANMLRIAKENIGQTYATLTQAWLGVGEGARLFPFFREALAAELVFAAVDSEHVAKREHYIAVAQELREQKSFPSYEEFCAEMARRFSMTFEAIEATLYADLEDFRLVEDCPLESVTDVFAAYHMRQIALLGDHATKVILSPSSKGRSLSEGKEMPSGDGKKLLHELAHTAAEWNLIFTVDFSGKERTCLISSKEFPFKTAPSTPLIKSEHLGSTLGL